MPLDLDIRGPIAKGAQGSVLLAFDRTKRRFCALKILKAASDIDAQRLLAASRGPVSGDPDPWEIACEDVGDGRDLPEAVQKSLGDGRWIWMSMRYIHGPNALELALGDAVFSWAESTALCAQVAQKLARRPAGRGHFDLKPENVLIDLEGRVFLVDGQKDGTAGTPAYAAPEQRVPGGTIDPRADLFALGRLLLRLLTRTFPSAGDSPDLQPAWPADLEDLPPERRQAARDLVTLGKTLCALEPADRGDIEKVTRRLHELAVALGDLDLTSVLRASLQRAQLPERLARLGAELAREPKAAGEPRTQPQFEPKRAIVQALLLSAALGTFAWWGLSHASASPSASEAALRDARPYDPGIFDPSIHRSARMTVLTPGEKVDPRHGYFKITANVPVVSVSLLAPDETTLWRTEKPTGVYPFDLAPGTYFMDQERVNRLDPQQGNTHDKRAFTMDAQGVIGWVTSRAPESAPIAD
jgi:serine/threonine protein kinase